MKKSKDNTAMTKKEFFHLIETHISNSGYHLTTVMGNSQLPRFSYTINPSDEPEENIRVVSLGTIIGIDQSLLCSLDLDVGAGIWRDAAKLKWNKWK